MNALKMNSLITRSLPKEPVTMSAIAKPTIITNAKKPTTLFSLIELLSLNKSWKNFFIILVIYLPINIPKSIDFDILRKFYG
jgi:hypothetical protein